MTLLSPPDLKRTTHPSPEARLVLHLQPLKPEFLPRLSWEIQLATSFAPRPSPQTGQALVSAAAERWAGVNTPLG